VIPTVAIEATKAIASKRRGFLVNCGSMITNPGERKYPKIELYIDARIVDRAAIWLQRQSVGNCHMMGKHSPDHPGWVSCFHSDGGSQG
jgi:hypothetical protein